MGRGKTISMDVLCAGLCIVHTARASGYRVNIASLSLLLSSAYPTHPLPTGYSDVVGSTREDVYETSSNDNSRCVQLE